MSKIVRSARGEAVNVDLLKIKQQMADIPTSVNVGARQKYVEQKSSKAKKPEDVIKRHSTTTWNVLESDENSEVIAKDES